MKGRARLIAQVSRQHNSPPRDIEIESELDLNDHQPETILAVAQQMLTNLQRQTKDESLCHRMRLVIDTNPGFASKKTAKLKN